MEQLTKKERMTKIYESKNSFAIHRNKFFVVEPRGIGPLYPSDNNGFLTRGSPLNSTKPTYHVWGKKKDRASARTFRDSIESVVANLSLASLYILSSALSTSPII